LEYFHAGHRLPLQNFRMNKKEARAAPPFPPFPPVRILFEPRRREGAKGGMLNF
jgi:hypothetical protein